jgi:integrative and conjugative element protein (TIGR02256 family)
VQVLIFRSETLTVHVAEDVADFLRGQRQRLWYQNERAGQLFGHFDGAEVFITKATGPRRGDRANHVSYDIDPKAAQREIDEHFVRGLHFIGDWHTHPEKEPSPSKRDRKSMNALFKTSKHDLKAMIMLIVGYDAPALWWCSVHGAFGMTEMMASPEIDD